MSTNLDAWLELIEVLVPILLGWIIAALAFSSLIWVGWNVMNGSLGLPDLSWVGALGLYWLLRGLNGAWRGSIPS